MKHIKLASIIILGLLPLASVTSAEEIHKVRKVSAIVSLLEESGFEAFVLTGRDPKRVVVVSPAMVGRVMATGLDGVDGGTDSWIYEEQIKKGATTSGPGGQWAAFGGDERIWYAPEGGQFALFFPSEQQNMEDYLVPEVLNSTRYRLTELAADGRSIRFAAPIHLKNIKGTEYDLEVTRRIEVLDDCPYTVGHGDAVEFTGFESRTWTRNTGDEPITKERGALATWTVGMFPSYPRSIVVLPYRVGPESELGPAVNTEYFNTDMIPTDKALGDKPYDNYWAVKDNFALVKTNGNVHTKIEMGPKRSLGRAASIDLEHDTLTILEFRQYPEMDYTASYWLPYDGDPHEGAAISIFSLAGDLGVPPFHELECLSPTLLLDPGQQYCHISRTYRLRGDKDAIAEICRRYFHADMESLREFDRNAP